MHSRCFSCKWKSGKYTPRAAFVAFDPAVVGGVARTASRVAELGINESSRTDRNFYRNSLNLGWIDFSNTSVPLYGALVEGACCVLFFCFFACRCTLQFGIEMYRLGCCTLSLSGQDLPIALFLLRDGHEFRKTGSTELVFGESNS